MLTFVRFGSAAALALLCTYSVADATDREGTWATLERVQETPEAWLGTPFTFEGRFHRLGEIYQPFFTIFDSFKYMNFAAWDEGKDLGDRMDFMSSFSLLYIDRTGSNPVENLLALDPYQRFQATAVVKSVFDGMPFIQVIDVIELDRNLSAHEIRHRAFEGTDLAAANCDDCGEDTAAHLAADKVIKNPEVTIEVAAPSSIEIAIPTENIPAENIPAENIPAENIPAENIPAENIPTATSNPVWNSAPVTATNRKATQR